MENNTYNVQHLLSALSYHHDICDGIPGPNTEEAIRRFQQDYGELEVDGIAGEKTFKAIRHAVCYGMPECEPVEVPASVRDLIAIARGELGYHEKATNENLYMKKAPNDGDGNFTKFADENWKAGLYQANKNGYEWCAVFVDNCWLHLFGMDAEKSQAAHCQTGIYGAGCEQSASYYRSAGRLDKSPRVGDQCFFGDYDHTGIVSEVSGNRVRVIEGNCDHQVKENWYTIGSGWSPNMFGHPYFDDEPAAEAPAEQEFYTVQEGDTLWDIAQDNGTTVEELLQLNPEITDPGVIHVGQKIRIK